MLCLLIALLAPAPPVPVEVEADRIELTAAGWRATQVTLSTAGGRLTAASAQGQPSAACPDGALSLAGPLTLDVPGARLDANDATLCLPGGAFTAQGARVQATRLRAGAESMQWQDGSLVAADGWFSACGCDDAPWRVSASEARIEPGEGAWATWPVLWAGAVPVLAAPVAYVPLARRRTGVLLPALGFDADDGLWARLPVFIALGPSLDVTLSPGWRDGFALDGRMRWAASAIDAGEVEGGFAAPDGGFVAGRGTAVVGPLRAAVDGGWADSATRWRARRPGFVERTRSTLFAEAGAAAVGSGVAVGVRAGRLVAIDPGTAAAGAVGAGAGEGGEADGGAGAEANANTEAAGGLARTAITVAPELWTTLSGAVGPLAVGFDALIGRYADPTDTREVFDLGLDAASTHWLGPLRLRPIAATRTRIHPAAQADAALSGQRIAAFAALEAEVAVARRYSAGRHVAALTLDARAADFAITDEPPVLDARDRPLASRAVGATVSTRWSGPHWQADARLRVDYEARAPIEGFTPPWLRARIEGPWAGLNVEVAGADADLAGTDAMLAGLWAGAADGPRIDLRWLRFTADPTLPWLLPRGPVAPVQQWDPAAAGLLGMDGTSDRPQSAARLHGMTAGATFAAGPLRLAWQGAFDLGRGHYVGQLGTARWQGRCDCWSAGVWLGHEAGRPAPDVMLTLTLGAGGDDQDAVMARQ